jgi:hypothetical protein
MGYGEDKGVIPRICESLFYFKNRTPNPDNFKVDACYLEVYNEQISDLLCPAPKEQELVFLSAKERIKVETKLNKLLKSGEGQSEEVTIVCLCVCAFKYCCVNKTNNQKSFVSTPKWIIIRI